ncbi:MAG: hypothetical protein LKJ17_00090 [Oscillospiraceae bacterium]|nr:hypothetical protein [Oscillospiraceae bacterium]
MKKTMTDVSNGILNSIQYMVDRAISKAKFDRTEQGTIIANLGNNQYTVRIDGVEYAIPSSLPSSIITYLVNDVVLITYFQNQNENAYITGKVVK